MPPCPIDERGIYTDEVPDFKGLYVKVRRAATFRPASSALTRSNSTGRRQGYHQAPQGARPTNRFRDHPAFVPLLLAVSFGGRLLPDVR